jgi:hypothetical protein
MEAGLIEALIGSGPLGLLIVYLIIERKQDRADKKEASQERLAHDERRLQADLKLATALTALCMKITGNPGNDAG